MQPNIGVTNATQIVTTSDMEINETSFPSVSANVFLVQQQPHQQPSPSQRRASSSVPVQAITITLQYGSQKEAIVVERSQDSQVFELFRQKARQMVERQLTYLASSNGNCSSNNYSGTSVTVGELQLFLHDYKSANMLEHLTSLVQLDNGSVVEIIRIERNERPTRLHVLQVNTYMTPTFCDYCGEILMGLIKQGLQCSLCKCNFHKKCAFAPRNNCAKNDPIAPNTFLASGQAIEQLPYGSVEQQFSTAFTAPSISGVADSAISSLSLINTTITQPQPPPQQQHQQQQVSALPTATPLLQQQFQLPHTLSFHNYKTPTVCKVCDKMLLGFIKQGMRCRDCKVNVHKKCAAQLPMNCQLSNENAVTPTGFEQPAMPPPPTPPSRGCAGHGNALQPTVTNPSMSMIMDCSNLVMGGGGAVMGGGANTDYMLIPLARLPGSASSRSGRQGPLCEGWMIHFVLQPSTAQQLQPQQETRRLRHYWILANGKISMYNEYNDGVNPNRVYNTIQLAEIIALVPYNDASLDPAYPPHCFEIRTISNVTYCVGENLESLSSGAPPPSKLPKHYGPYNITNWRAWFQALQQSLQPPASRTDPVNAEPALQFSQLYQVLRDKVLGSGQFGTVYGGIHRQSGKEVAVKVIAKDRFSKRTNAGVETLKSEVAILQAIDHHGIIRLESMFETKDKIFVVMEKMNGDMLEMILSQATGRLDERHTKYLIMQIMNALRYLHSRGIAHCDLKPENVLLSDLKSNYPQTKLCDFGYARFIGDAQFRKTMVGTPAYLAPEVLKKKGYNKSLDMWSVGVIIYVTLSGTFPFNDCEEISEQIQNASFMFPSDPWKRISKDAIDLIQNLLRVQIEERLAIDECVAHPWLQDGEVYCDLRKLEKRLNIGRYLTSEQDDVRFMEFIQREGLL